MNDYVFLFFFFFSFFYSIFCYKKVGEIFPKNTKISWTYSIKTKNFEKNQICFAKNKILEGTLSVWENKEKK
jgi:hypothetical protein